MALRGKIAVQENISIATEGTYVELVKVAGKGILKGLAYGSGTAQIDYFLQMTLDGSVSEIRLNELFISLGSSSGGIWGSADSGKGQLVLNLPFQTGFTIKIRRAASGTSYYGTILWAVEE
ncbi:hypothetical protein AMS60_05680 [Bacillus sp. FJAT-21945]|nr:hypothetical protein AMS60_05680 [Bacillus sp. FJAT-21945]